MELKGQSTKFFGVFAKVYGLYDKDGNLFYIGLTTMLIDKRLAQHISDARQPYNKSNKSKHIRALRFKVNISVLDILWLTNSDPYFDLAEARQLERNWIQKFTSDGIALTNSQHNRPIKENPLNKEVELWHEKQQFRQR